VSALRAILILIVSLALACAVAAVAWAASKGHVLLFPLILIFGVPLLPLLRRRNDVEKW
jgi:uncharacterized membrane protein